MSVPYKMHGLFAKQVNVLCSKVVPTVILPV